MALLFLAALPVPAATVVEFYNADLDQYFITADADEQAIVDSGIAGRWLRTGETFQAGGPAQVCRFYGNTNTNPATGRIYGPNSHFYTASESECVFLRSSYRSDQASWMFESYDFTTTPARDPPSPCPAGTIPVYRAYNNGFARGVTSNHRITSSRQAIQDVVAKGWIDEGVRMCAPPAVLETASLAMSANAGGTISLPGGGSVTLPPGALAGDQTATLTLLREIPTQPRGQLLRGVGRSLWLSARISSNPSGVATFSIAEATGTAGLPGAIAIADVKDDNTTHSFFAVTSRMDGANAVASVDVPLTLSAGANSLYVSMANLSTVVPKRSVGVTAARNTLGARWREWDGNSWGNYATCPPAGAKVLVLVHGVNSRVEQAYGACVETIRQAGHYDRVVGINYDWPQSVKRSGGELGSFLNTLATCRPSLLDIEAHSLGGAVTGAALTQGFLQPGTLGLIRNVTTLGTPWLGTPLAAEGVGIGKGLGLMTGLMNIAGMYGPLDSMISAESLQASDVFYDLQPGSQILRSIQDQVSLLPINFVLGAGTVPDMPAGRVVDWLAQHSSLGKFDDLVWPDSAQANGVNFARPPRRISNPVGHRELTCDPSTRRMVSDSLLGTCSYSLSPSAAQFGSDGGNAEFSVFSQEGCQWTATTSQPAWLTLLLPGPSGSGSGTVGYAVAQNHDTQSRSGTITIAQLGGAGANTQRSFTVTQAGAPPCTFTLATQSAAFSSGGGDGNIAVSSAAECAWTVVSNVPWIAVTSDANSRGSATSTYHVQANTSTNSRSGTMTIAGQTFTVSQAGATPPPGSTMNFSVVNQCNNGTELHYRFFDRANGLQWPPDTSLVYFNLFGQTSTSRLSCISNALICLGGASADGRSTWGVGLNDTSGCTGCCYRCDGGSHSLTLTCDQYPPPPPPPGSVTSIAFTGGVGGFGSFINFRITPALSGISVTCTWAGSSGSHATRTTTTISGNGSCANSDVASWPDARIVITATVTGTDLSTSITY